MLGGLSVGHYIVEIKKPATPLVKAKKPYRNGVFAPSADLSGAVTQVLFQRSALHSNWLIHQSRDELRESRPDVVKCVVVAGFTPNAEAHRRSFEVFRNSCKDVEVITFDELLGKLKLLLKLLTPEQSADTEPPF